VLGQNRTEILAKSSYFNNFLTNKNQKILISTSALSMGVDAFNILYTIYIFKQYSMTDFIQESNRVARNLKSGSSILFVNEKEYTIKNIDLDVEVDFKSFKKIDYNVLCDFIHEKTCRRKIISKYYDNKIISQCNVNIQVLCDLCEKRHNELNKRKEKQLTSENVNYLQLEILKDKLISLQDICIFCFITQEFDDMWSHTIYTCIKKEKSKMNTQLDTLQTMIQNNYMLKSGSCCYTCLLPQLLCNKNDHTCEFKNVVLEFNFVIAILVQSKRYQSNICSFEIAKNVNKFAEFICKSITFHNTDSINAIKLIKEFNLQEFINKEVNELKSDEDENISIENDENDENILRDEDEDIFIDIEENTIVNKEENQHEEDNFDLNINDINIFDEDIDNEEMLLYVNEHEESMKENHQKTSTTTEK